MELTKKERTIKYVVYAVILCLLSLLQNVGGLWFEIGGARCFLLVPAAVLLSLDEDEKASALIGLFAGLLWDITSVHHMGFSCLFLMVACYIMSVLLTHIFRPTFWVGTVGAIVFTFLYVLIYWLVFVAFKGGEGSTAVFFTFYLPSFFYTAVVTFFMNLVFVPLKNKLNKN